MSNGLRVLVCGGRDFEDRDFIHNQLCDIHSKRGPFAVVIHGDASGVDSEAMRWAMMMGIKHVPFRAEWRVYGRAAGPMRNERMLVEGKPGLVVAFPGGRGTADTLRRARDFGIETLVIAPK